MFVVDDVVSDVCGADICGVSGRIVFYGVRH